MCSRLPRSLSPQAAHTAAHSPSTSAAEVDMCQACLSCSPHASNQKQAVVTGERPKASRGRCPCPALYRNTSVPLVPVQTQPSKQSWGVLGASQSTWGVGQARLT